MPPVPPAAGGGAGAAAAGAGGGRGGRGGGGGGRGGRGGGRWRRSRGGRPGRGGGSRATPTGAAAQGSAGELNTEFGPEAGAAAGGGGGGGGGRGGRGGGGGRRARWNPANTRSRSRPATSRTRRRSRSKKIRASPLFSSLDRAKKRQAMETLVSLTKQAEEPRRKAAAMTAAMTSLCRPGRSPTPRRFRRPPAKPSTISTPGCCRRRYSKLLAAAAVDAAAVVGRRSAGSYTPPPGDAKDCAVDECDRRLFRAADLAANGGHAGSADRIARRRRGHRQAVGRDAASSIRRWPTPACSISALTSTPRQPRVADAAAETKKKPRRRNLWVTDTLQWAPEARLAQPANPMWDSAASAFPVRSQLPFELVCPLR